MGVIASLALPARAFAVDSLAAAALRAAGPGGSAAPSPAPPRAAGPVRGGGAPAGRPAGALTPAAAVPAARPANVAEVRLSLSAAAAKRLSEPRLRHLLEIEVADTAMLASTLSGALGDDVAYVWVDAPGADRILVQLLIADRPLARREVDVTGFAGDVAARLVAIAASELLRAQLAPVQAPPPSKPPPPRVPTAAEQERASRLAPALVFTPGAVVAFTPAVRGVLAGPSLAAGFRWFGLSETLFGRWLTGSSDAGSSRWFEGGLAVDYRLWLRPSVRLAFGVSAALAALHLGDARAVDGVPSQRDTWSGRAGGIAGVELRVASPLWLGLRLEPGAILRPVRYEEATAAGSPTRSALFDGLWMGVALGLHFEHVRPVVTQ